MNAFASTILWMSVQVALFSFVGFAAFMLLKRRGPNSATACAALVLGLTLPFALLMASPWPRWAIPTEVQHPVLPTTDALPIADGTAAHSPIAVEQTSRTTSDMLSIWWQTATEWMRPVSAQAAADSGMAWQNWLLIAIATGMGLGLLRLAAGIWAVGRLRNQSRVIDDKTLLAEVARLAALVGLASRAGASSQLDAPYEVRETSILRSAATIGWRRPILLLPADWRTWTETELRVVLAHELAHIAGRDYLTGLVARLAAAIHFYQPLVLWLSRQLRMQQELAADSRAAIVAGDRKTYLATLAQLALRADEQPAPWAARAFLPGTSMLIKRVAWLKRRESQNVETSLSRKARWVLGVTMAIVALAVAGVRGPSGSAAAEDGTLTPALSQAEREYGALAQDAAAAKRAILLTDGQNLLAQNGPNAFVAGQVPMKELRTFKYVPADAKLVAGISPSEIAKLPGVSNILSTTLDPEFLSKNGIKLSDLADVQLIFIDSAKQPQRAVLRTETPFDWKAALEKKYPNELTTRKFGGKEFYFVGKDNDPRDFESSYYIPDDRTMIFGTQEQIQKLLGGNEKTMQLAAFPSFLNQPIAVRVEMSLVKQMAGLDKSAKAFGADPMAAMFLPLLEHVQVIQMSAMPGQDSAGCALGLECDSDDAAQSVSKTLEALRTVGLNLINAKMKAWREEAAPPVPQEQIVMINNLFNMLVKGLTSAKIEVQGNRVLANANFELGPAIVAGFVMPAMAAARDAAMRTQNMDNMRQLALAMLMYEDKHGHLPPPSVIGPDGKTKHSWRVEILPLLNVKDADEVYKEYRMDEPWDSEHNRALIERIPAVLRDPNDDRRSGDSSYFMITGKGTVGGSGDGVKFKDIIDGTSKTVMLVEAKRDIPWTKPEDIEIDPDPAKPLPKFGGHWQGGVFGAAFADCHVQLISQEADPKEIRKVLTINGREPVDDAKLNSKPADKSWDESPKPAVGQSGANRIKLELRRAENSPSDGLVESAVLGQPEKIYLHPEAELSNDDFSGASVTTDDNGKPVVSVALTVEGAKKMAALSKEHMHKQLAIMLDGRVVLAPRIMSEMSGGVQINGNLTKEAAERIAMGLNGK